jgi:hypothetical protein
LLPAWVDAINTSIVDIVSVPTEWNKQCFIENGVIKPIIVEPHIYVDYPHKKTGLKHLLTKSILVCKNENTIDIDLPLGNGLVPFTSILLPLSIKNVNSISNSAGTAASYLSILT